MHKDMEAYSDFRMALHVNSINFPINDNQASNLELKLNTVGTLFQSGRFVTSLNSLLIYKPLLQSQITLNEKSLMGKMSQINFDSFCKGLAVGLMDGGVETIKELGPFIANLLFHPIETTEELLIAIQFLASKALEEEWETVFKALAPELKELFFTWDKIEDYHKGKLTGLFIGKNGVAALTGLGAIKTISKLKKVIIGSSKTKFSCLLKRAKPGVYPLPASELSLSSALKDKGWCLSYQGSNVVESKFYNENALGRRTSNVPPNKSILEAKAIKQSQELGIPFTTWEEFEKGALIEQGKVLSIDSRGIPASVVEAEIINTTSTAGKIEIALNEEGNVVSACLLQEDKAIVQEIAKTSSILIKRKNVIPHVMQKHHHWEKVIELTGIQNEDLKKC